VLEDNWNLASLHLGVVKRMLTAFMGAGCIERAKAVIGFVETLAPEEGVDLRGLTAVAILKHLPELGMQRLKAVQKAVGPATRHLYEDVQAYNKAIPALR